MQSFREIFSGKFGALMQSGTECTACPSEPASVTPHFHHVLVRLPKPPQLSASTITDSNASWWPDRVEEIESFKVATKTPGSLPRKVKFTAFDYISPSPAVAPIESGLVDVLIFPECVSYTAVPEEQAGGVIQYDLGAEDSRPELDPEVLARRAPLQHMTIIVCCHNARDSRCGNLGPPLAMNLASLMEEDGAQVIMSSHVGGHKYAGNVIVYAAGHPCSGHWFGGLCKKHAPEFVAALRESKDKGLSPVAHPVLRKHWRGEIKLSSTEQKEKYESVADIEDLDKN